MRTLTSMILGVAIALALGLSLDLIRRHNETGHGAALIAGSESAIFHQPRIGGLSLDIRLMDHVVANPLQTAERFCRDHGHSGVIDFMLRQGMATRTIGDGARHVNPGEPRVVFSMISCGSALPVVVASR